jgi:hypothetical protein
VTMLCSDEMAVLAVSMSAVLSGVGCYAMQVPLLGHACWLTATWDLGLGFRSLPFGAGHFILVYSASFLNPRV